MINDLYFIINDCVEGYSFEFLSKNSNDEEITSKIMSVFNGVNNSLKNDDNFNLTIEHDNLFLHDKSLSNTTLIGDLSALNIESLYDGVFNPYFQSYGGKISVFDNLNDLREYLVEDLSLNIIDCFKCEHPDIELCEPFSLDEDYSDEVDDLISLYFNTDNVSDVLSHINKTLKKHDIGLIDQKTVYAFMYPNLHNQTEINKTVSRRI